VGGRLKEQMMAWTDAELAELAQCARLGAVQARKDAQAGAVSVKDIHLRMAELRERLAERLEAARKSAVRSV
jgi:hypothetical protein